MLVNLLISLGWIVLIVMTIMYLCYCTGLAKIFSILGEKPIHAFVPLYNFACLIRLLKLPKRWFVLSLTPYVGAIYSVAVAYRLGLIFGRKLPFSVFWLTMGSPLGMLYIGYRTDQIHLEVLEMPVPNIKQLQRSLLKLKNSN